VLVDVVIDVDANLTIVEGHQICDDIEELMKKDHNIMQVQVYIEPKIETLMADERQ
jgi:divalent metal cation (Fe/Co/Zn/Cd) transporter